MSTFETPSPYVILNSLDSASGHRVKSRINERNLPRLGEIRVNGHLSAVGEVERDIASVQEIVGEKFLYNVLFVSAAYNEIVISVMRIEFHDVPEYRHVAYLNHGFGDKVAFFADSCAETSG